jgi:monovalent cation:H+ antiporter-2, CPA2 family
MAVESVSHYKDILVVLGAATLVIPVFTRLGISSILAFLVTGILLGPDILGSLAAYVPSLSGIAISNPDELGSLAELGIVFLLFLIGLELSPKRLLTMKRLVFGLGLLQVAITSIALGILAVWAGYSSQQAIVVGMALSLSSTAIVVQLLSDAKRLGSQAGRTSFAVLLMQDIAVIPILLLIGLMAPGAGHSALTAIATTLTQLAAAAFSIVLISRYALRPVLRLVASTQSTDLFLAAVLFIAVGTGALATWAGLSMSLGAFIAGLMLAETEYRRAIEAIIEPFKGLLLGAFFLLVGINLDLAALAQSPLRIIGTALLLITFKAAIIYAMARTFKVSRRAALESALLLGSCGEFAFVAIAAAVASGVFALAQTSEILLVVSITMMLIPALSKLSAFALTKLPTSTAPAGAEAAALPEAQTGHVIVAGFGRVGTLVGSMLDEHQIPYVAVDGDAALVTRARNTQMPVYFGDAVNIEFLRKCGLDHARALAITMDNPAKAEAIVSIVRKYRGDIKIIARARDERHAMRLYLAGATEAVPETIESSLQLGEALLVETGVPMGLAIASIHERRDGFRKLLGRPNRREELRNSRQRLRKHLK